MPEHTCDRKGPPAKVIDDPDGDQEITCIYPTCSVCGVPQVSTDRARAGSLADRALDEMLAALSRLGP